jgi:hypothetical protein
MLVKKGFPTIKRDTVATRGGNFYMINHKGRWKKTECYLPASPTTYGFESMEELANKFLDEFESGKRVYKSAVMEKGGYDCHNYDHHIKKWFPDTP